MFLVSAYAETSKKVHSWEMRVFRKRGSLSLDTPIYCELDYFRVIEKMYTYLGSCTRGEIIVLNSHAIVRVKEKQCKERPDNGVVWRSGLNKLYMVTNWRSRPFRVMLWYLWTRIGTHLICSHRVRYQAACLLERFADFRIHNSFPELITLKSSVKCSLKLS